MWNWTSYFEFVGDNMAIPAGVSVCLWLLLSKRNRKCGDEAKRALAISISLLLSLAPMPTVIRLVPSLPWSISLEWQFYPAAPVNS